MGNFEFYRSKHQADNLAKLRQEFLSVTKLIAKIFGAVSRTRKHPSETKPNVHVVRDFGADECCKERSYGIAIVTLCVNRVRCYSLLAFSKKCAE